MKYKITCDYCFEDNEFDILENKPVVCKLCNSPIGHLEARDSDEKFNILSESQKVKTLDGLLLIYEKTNAWIEIPHAEIVVLGRQSVGADVFAKIPQISREHCKIEYLDGNYVLTDLNSLNGTFLGQNKRDCHKHIQEKIKDNDVIYLGREPFMVQLKFKTVDTEQAKPAQVQQEEIKLKKFKCRACGKIHTMNLLICDTCGSYGQVEPLEH